MVRVQRRYDGVKLFLLWGTDHYHDTEFDILGVFTTRELAQEHGDKMSKYYEVNTKEVVLDVPAGWWGT